jgi:hypothetical protein
MSFVIYLDRNATTPILPEVLEAMMPYLATEWGVLHFQKRRSETAATNEAFHTGSLAPDGLDQSLLSRLKSRESGRMAKTMLPRRSH